MRLGGVWTAALILLAVIGSITFVLRIADPEPPREVTITTGGEAGAYYAFGKRYAQSLARAGVTLHVLPSAGSMQNLDRLRDPKSGVSVALLQGGIGDATSAPGINSLGRVFHEPLWVFYRGEAVDKLSDLASKRIAVGPEGSGNRVLAMALLQANHIGANATYSPLTAQPAVDAMRAGEVDAVFLALAPQAPLIQQLLHAADIKLMSFPQAEAYTKIFPYLAKLTLPRGVIDLAADIPSRDVTLVAPTAVLVARTDLHPAIVALLAEAAANVHGQASLFSAAGEFPSLHDPEFKMDADAVRFYKSGPTFWKSIFPFWLANLAERLVLLAVPLIGIILPLSRALPAAYRWRIRQRLLSRYKQLKRIEDRLGELPRGSSTAAISSELDDLDDAVAATRVPTQFSEQYYDLRAHVDQVRQRLLNRPV